MTCQEQLDLWVSGKSVHNPTRNECCPDFSCCQPRLQWPEAKRRQFAQAGRRERDRMLFGSLYDLLKSKG